MGTNWGILATGNISNSMAQALTDVPDANPVAVASRTDESAAAFAAKWQIPRHYGSYEALAADPDVDVVYIGTPHNLHYDNMLMCLNNGKHVLCEKPLTLNAREAQECIELARAKGLFLMEAVWMRYFPAIQQVRAWLADGLIGDIRFVQADFCINIPYDPAHRLYNPELGGGALLDLGIYPISLAGLLLGLPSEVRGHAHIGQTGVDELDALTFIYENGATAQLSCSMRVHKPIEAHIVGTEGYIKIHQVFLHADWLTIQRDGQEPQTVRVPYAGNGYRYEVEEVHRRLANGQLESPLMTLDETLATMKLMDQLRAEWGVRYAADDR